MGRQLNDYQFNSCSENEMKKQSQSKAQLEFQSTPNSVKTSIENPFIVQDNQGELQRKPSLIDFKNDSISEDFNDYTMNLLQNLENNKRKLDSLEEKKQQLIEISKKKRMTFAKNQEELQEFQNASSDDQIYIELN